MDGFRLGLTPVAELNDLDSSAFSEALQPLFEAAGPLVPALYPERPFASYEDLLDRAEAAAARLTTDAQIALVSGHPRIGEAAETLKQTSALSYREQGYDQEAARAPEDARRVDEALAELNRAYEQRFGFRFVVFVNGRPRSAIVEVLRERLRNSPDVELQAAVQAMFAIARDRLTRLSANG